MEREIKVGYHKKPRAIWFISLCTALFLGGVAHAAPQYTLTCSSCHGMPPLDDPAGRVPATGAFKGNHISHLPASATINNNGNYCLPCHNTASYNTSHMTGQIGLQANINNSPFVTGKYLNLSLQQVTFKNQTSIPVLGTCTTVNCHFTTTTPSWGSAAFTYTDATINDCDQCHGLPSNTGSHTAHMTKYGAGVNTCAKCHPNHAAPASNPAKFAHATSVGNRDLIVTFAGSFTGGGTYTGSTKKSNQNFLPGGTGTYGTCNTTYCHSSGAPVWGSTTPAINCASCHPTLSGAHSRHIGGLTLSSLPFYRYTANKSSGSDTTTVQNYGFGCANCHPYTESSHVNGTVEVLLTADAAAGSLRAKNVSPTVTGSGLTTECGNVYCHSDGKNNFRVTGQWGTTYTAALRCTKCHDNAPATGAHSAHAVGIHYDDIFSGRIGKLTPTSTTTVASPHGDLAQSTTISCNICHNATTSYARNKYNNQCTSCHTEADSTGAARITGLAKHVNGTVELSFAPVNVVSKAQLRPGSFADYTAAGGFWTRNGSNYKNGNLAFDTAKTALANTMWNAGNCSNIACHNGKTVNWADKLSCVDCHSKL